MASSASRPTSPNGLYCLYDVPKKIDASCCRQNETPSALISGAIRGARAFRSGRYAKRSTPTPSRPAPIIADASMAKISRATGTSGLSVPPSATSTK